MDHRLLSAEITVAAWLLELRQHSSVPVAEPTALLRYDRQYDCLELHARAMPVVVLDASRLAGWSADYDQARDLLILDFGGDCYPIRRPDLMISFEPFFENIYWEALYGR